jgi:hypothetical protein
MRTDGSTVLEIGINVKVTGALRACQSERRAKVSGPKLKIERRKLKMSEPTKTNLQHKEQIQQTP